MALELGLVENLDFGMINDACLTEFSKRESIPEMKKNVFKTETGKYLLEQMFEKSKR